MNRENKGCSHETLKESVKNAVAIRLRRRLQPAGGEGDKIFPPTYEGGKYAWEERVISGEKIPCVILDSVQSQANRMELTLLRAWQQEEFTLPVISVDFKGHGIDDLGKITSLEVPHRIADAIIRDSETKKGLPFPKDPGYNLWLQATPSNATPLFSLCPSALLFGVWFHPLGGPGNRGNLGTRFQRAIVSEVFAVNVKKGVATGGQSNPLQLAAQEYYCDANKNDERTCWGTEESNTLNVRKEKLSEINHGSITPDYAYARDNTGKTILEEDGSPRIKGGITMEYALQTVVLSLAALRNLSFPMENKDNTSQNECNILARTVLAALGLCAATKSAEENFDFRSRCLLVSEAPASWEILHKDGSATCFTLSGEEASMLVKEAVAEAQKANLPWHEEEITLTPSKKLVSIVTKSRSILKKSTATGEEEA